MKSRFFAMGICFLAGLAACGGGVTPTPKNISGTVSINTSSLALTAPYVPGEVLVQFKNAISAQSASLQVAGVTLQNVRRLALENTRLFKSNGNALELAAALRQRSDVRFAHPNFIMQATAVPNDSFYDFQWHYPAINLPQAWDIEQGTTNPVTVAVLDSGILKSHPDFAGKIVGGYDMITNPQIALDGNGRDSNAEDPGDQSSANQSSYHGSHVSGTIAAATNNTIGVAGVSWGAKILPIRVLGKGGGALADILEGMLWAAGLPVDGLPTNPNPAQILNMSLGGSYTCAAAPIYQQVIDQVNTKGAIIVVAAGNENSDASQASPASCSGVITVGATDFAGARAPYSNFGTRIDVMAPGGDTSVDLNNDQRPDGVLSLNKNDQTGAFNYIFENGTSMASPHVAGVIALLKSRDPSLTYARALEILKRTARVLTPTKCTGSGTAKTSQDCGAGLIDAQAALQALGNPSTPTPDFSFSLNPSSIRAQPGSSVNVQLVVQNLNGFNGTIDIGASGQPSGVTFGQISNNILPVQIAGNVPNGAYAIILEASSGALKRRATLTLDVQSSQISPPTIQNTVIVACFYTPNDICVENKSKGQTISGTGSSSNYNITDLETGNYILVAIKDINNNDNLDDEDLLGIYIKDNDIGLVTPPASNIQIELTRVQNISQSALKTPYGNISWQAVRQVFKRR